MKTLVDKIAIMQIFGCLINDPAFFNEFGEDLKIQDFDSNFTKSIYNAIYNLFQLGADRVTIIDIDNYLKQYGGLYSEFNKNQGITYLQDCVELAQPENIKYYFNRVKKFSVLRTLDKAGFDISDIYSDIVDDPKKQKEQIEHFDSMTIDEIFDLINRKIARIEYDYSVTNDNSCNADEGIVELKEELKRNPEIGAPLQGEIYNSIVRGARKGKFYLNSGASGSGKSRRLIGDACKLAYPYSFNNYTNSWEKTGSTEKSLIITTELDKDEVKTVILAYLSGVNEEKILYGSYEGDEEARVDQAIEYMVTYPNLFIERIADPNIKKVKAIIKKQISINRVQNVFYDYIFSSPELLGEFRDLKIREDVVLTMLSTALKDIATDYNVFVESGTQLSGDYDNWEGVRNQTLLQGAKAIANKIDMGAITSAVQDRDRSKLAAVIQKGNYPAPTHVMDIYKLRRGRYKNVRIWGIMDLGTGRWQDLFVTDGNYHPISVTVPNIILASNMIDLTAERNIQETKETVVKVEEKKDIQRKDGWNYYV